MLGDLQGPPITDFWDSLYDAELWEMVPHPPHTSHLFSPSKGIQKAGAFTVNVTKQMEMKQHLIMLCICRARWTQVISLTTSVNARHYYLQWRGRNHTRIHASPLRKRGPFPPSSLPAFRFRCPSLLINAENLLDARPCTRFQPHRDHSLCPSGEITTNMVTCDIMTSCDKHWEGKHKVPCRELW